ncbi:MAG: glycosyltransferase [Anaerolineales bacterium]|nr:glycosyltransferase [Anaerolineales bacterium]
MDNADNFLTQPSVTAVVCTRNRGERIVKTIESLLANRHPNYEVLVVDQSTNSETEAAVNHLFSDPRLRYIRSATRGTGLSRGLGLTNARGSVVAYTDDDCTVPEDWLEKMEAVFALDAKIAVAFCNVVPAPHDETAGFVPAYIRQEDMIVRTVWDKCRARGIGAGMAVRRQPVLSYGSFDPLLGPGTEFSDCEDGDIAVRALLNGWWVFETAQTHVIHDGFRTWQEGKELNKRNWTGIGAAYAKPIRCGRWQAGVIVAYEALVVALLKPFSRVFLLKKPQGVRSFYYFCRGFWHGFQQSVDCEYMVYRNSEIEGK